MGRNAAPVRFDGQTDLVIWDADQKTEHFVRDARFETEGDLGFLAPTPNVPTLSAASPEAFDILARICQSSDRSNGGSGGFGKPTNNGVQVVKVEKVAGYEAAVLRAGDADALKEWLDENDYPAPEWLQTWVQPYLDKRWTITAFKVGTNGAKATGPVRMTFRTNTPFAPYAIPAENGATGSRLRLFLVSARELDVALGRELWSVEARHRAKLSDANRTELAKTLRLRPDAIPAGASVREFVDPNFGKEPKEDLFFIPSPRLPAEEGDRKDGRDGQGFLLLGSALIAAPLCARRKR